MKIWRNSPLDSVLLGLSLAQFIITVCFAALWAGLGWPGRIASFAGLVLMAAYNIIVISHLFTHQRWFVSPVLNGAVSMLNSANIGQSVQDYELSHVRNHHRYNNDRQGSDGTTKDLTSTYRDGSDGEHADVVRYCFVGAASTMVDVARALFSVTRGWGVGAHETQLLTLASGREEIRKKELRQVRLDRMAHFLFIGALAVVSWQWLLLCYFPALYLAFAFVNIQNYYRHYGATPEARYANSVSYYGRLYNLLTFNDGHHQEHHLRPSTHWSRLPGVRAVYAARMAESGHVVSPVPAVVGFLDRKR